MAESKKEFSAQDAAPVVLYALNQATDTVAHPVLGNSSGALSFVQSVVADDANSSTTNLTAANSRTFTGTSSSTLGVAGIQVSLFADQNCGVSVQQSPDGTNWDLKDGYIYYANSNFGITVQAISSYTRVVVSTSTTSVTTSTFRLQTALCPIVEAVPRSLDQRGNFKVALQSNQDHYGFESENTPMGEVRVAEVSRLVGATFDGSTFDTNFWTATSAGTGTLTQALGELTLAASSNSTDSIQVTSVRRARYVSANAMRFRGVVRLTDAGRANNIRAWGIAYGAALPTITDGAYFKLSGTTFSVETVLSSTASTIASGSFNGNLGTTYTPGTNNATYEIYWTNSKAIFVVNDEVLHTVTAPVLPWSSTVSQHIYLKNSNSDVTTASTLICRVASISRLGSLMTAPIYKWISGNAATYILKYGAGVLHKFIFNNSTGTAVRICDNTAGTTANTIAFITTATSVQGSWDYEVPFFNGLTIITTGNGLDATVVYE